MKHILTAVLLLFLLCSWDSRDKLVMDIAGEWTVQLDSTGIGLQNGWQNKAFKQVMRLPGTTDDARSRSS